MTRHEDRSVPAPGAEGFIYFISFSFPDVGQVTCCVPPVLYLRWPSSRIGQIEFPFGSAYTDMCSIKNRKTLPAAHVAVMDDERAETYVIQGLSVKARDARRFFYATKFNTYEWSVDVARKLC